MPEKEMDLISGSLTDESIENMFLTFRVADEDYAVGIEYVTEIVGIQDFKKVPDVPAFIKGVINLRGKVIPIMDVRIRFGLPSQEYTERTCIIVLEVEGGEEAQSPVSKVATDCKAGVKFDLVGHKSDGRLRRTESFKQLL